MTIRSVRRALARISADGFIYNREAKKLVSVVKQSGVTRQERRYIRSITPDVPAAGVRVVPTEQPGYSRIRALGRPHHHHVHRTSR